MKLLAHLFAGTAIALLSACSVLPKSEPQQIYRLPATPLPHDGGATVNWSLRVDTPQAERMIDSSRITVQPQGDTMSVYKGARWSDSATTLLRNRLVDAFRDNGRITGLSSDETSLQADYFLSGDLRAFQTVYENGQPVVVIRFDARLVKSNGLRIVASRRFDISQPVSGTAVPQVVTAFGQATDTLASQLVNWTLQQPLDGRDAHAN
ncbi:ABC-type transport auxiliary lipoprotein family protein [Dyella terrae]|uniref:ABC-type transport auxiliary lipoprotein family protein n=1 Tax=Dyella terrae TaxID=522259 RepID=UPI001EFCE0BA|nr:ABC-type transport auxiliary lipoprotein family protein [Dyella terrae]ULU25190.1 ABC-type transport auxiliary lipoprotein family protein [Dyella terrae]